MESLYNFLEDHNYFWDRKNKDHIYVALNGYRVFDERYEALTQAVSAAKALIVSDDFDQISGKTFYIIKHK